MIHEYIDHNVILLGNSKGFYRKEIFLLFERLLARDRFRKRRLHSTHGNNSRRLYVLMSITVCHYEIQIKAQLLVPLTQHLHFRAEYSRARPFNIIQQMLTCDLPVFFSQC